MATVIGLRSGKEFFVEDEGYLFRDSYSGEVTEIFVSLDKKRIITIPPKDKSIEYYDVPYSDDIIGRVKNNVGNATLERMSDDYI